MHHETVQIVSIRQISFNHHSLTVSLLDQFLRQIDSVRVVFGATMGPFADKNSMWLQFFNALCDDVHVVQLC